MTPKGTRMSKPLPTKLLQEAVDALVRSGGNRAQAAQGLGLARDTFNNRIKVASANKIVSTVSDPNSPKVLQGQIKRLEAELKTASKLSDQAEIVKAVIGSMARQVEE